MLDELPSDRPSVVQCPPGWSRRTGSRFRVCNQVCVASIATLHFFSDRPYAVDGLRIAIKFLVLLRPVKLTGRICSLVRHLGLCSSWSISANLNLVAGNFLGEPRSILVIEPFIGGLLSICVHFIARLENHEANKWPQWRIIANRVLGYMCFINHISFQDLSRQSTQPIRQKNIIYRSY